MASKKYKNPPIEEALCEFAFASETPQIDFTLPGKLVNHEKTKEYSGPSRTQNVQTIMAPVNAAPFAVHDAVARIQMPTPDGKKLLAVGANTLSVSILKPYDGWEAFKPRLEAALTAYSEVTGQTNVQRIGLRYINRIIVPTPDANASEYLTQVNWAHESLGILQNSFMSREEYLQADGARIIVQQVTLLPADPGTTEYLIDVDAVWNAGLVEGLDAIMAKAEELHTIEGLAFEGLITTKSRELFDAD
jgi:uncharacterized protein (TIGR04255 family)